MSGNEWTGDRWISVGEAAAVASRDKSTIRRWADQHLVVSRRSAGGHRQVLLSSLHAVLVAGDPPLPERIESTAGRVLFERWLAEAVVLRRWALDQKLPMATLESFRARLVEVEDTVAYLTHELDSAIAAAETGW